MMKNILIVFGTRPEAIKIAPVARELRRRAAEEGAPLRLFLCSTGQHREMLRPLFEHFEIAPDIDLDIMEPDQTLAGLSARALRALDATFARADLPPMDITLVQGDTTTAMCAALAAYYRRVPCGHIEAGLRTNNLYAPFPEEVNRRIISQIATWHFPPTPAARENLERSGLAAGQRAWVTGNTVIDALLWTAARARSRPPAHPLLGRVEEWRAARPEARVVLITGHRRENFGAPFESFCRGLLAVARAHPRDLLVYPVHLNPNVQRPVRAMLGGAPNIWLEPPLDYPVFVALMDRSALVITDSGGVQEEAPSLGKPVLVTREVTERAEALEAGTVRLTGPREEEIYRHAHELLSDPRAWAAMANRVNPYGDGRAAARIADALLGLPVEEFTPPPFGVQAGAVP